VTAIERGVGMHEQMTIDRTHVDATLAVLDGLLRGVRPRDFAVQSLLVRPEAGRSGVPLTRKDWYV
jgi:hypothetical protein